MSEQTHSPDAVAKLGALIKNIKVAMLTTIDTDGTLRARPMATQNAEFDGDLWFFTHASDPKVDEIEREHQVNVAYSDPGNQTYVSVSGLATLVRDRTKAEELWSPAMKAWFPQGIEDPELAMLRVHVEKAEYWDAPSSTFVHVVGFVKAVTTGKTYQPGENEKLTLDPVPTAS